MTPIPTSVSADQPTTADAYRERIAAAIQKHAAKATTPRPENSGWGRRWGRP